MKKNYLFPPVVCALLSAVNPSYAEISASLTEVSDRLLRGFSLSDEEPSLYGGVHYKSDTSGLYADAVLFSNIQIHGERELQVDAVAGYKFDVDAMVLDLGYVHHAFSEFSETDSGEVYVGGIFNNYSLHYYDNVDVNETYIDANASFNLKDGYKLSLHAGRLDSDDNDAVDFNDYKIQINRDINLGYTFDLGLAYSYNDNKEALEDLAGSRFVLSLSKVW